MLHSRRLLLCLACATALVFGGCLSSPTLPLPPPATDQPTVPVDGQTRISGAVPLHDLGVRVLALNANSHMIFGESTESSRFSFLAEARSGDVFVIWYTVGDEESEPVEVTVPYPVGNGPNPTVDAAAADSVDGSADAATNDQ